MQWVAEGCNTTHARCRACCTHRSSANAACIVSGWLRLLRRALILKQYAKQLGEEDLQKLAAQTGGMSGRDLRDVCEITERRWASKVGGALGTRLVA
jgi:hypothetical protein